MNDEKFVIVKYQTQKEVCHCCGQDLPNSQPSEVRGFEMKESDLGRLSAWDWDEIVEEDDNDNFDSIVDEFVHDVIAFYGTSEETIIVNSSELKKVKEFIISAVSN